MILATNHYLLFTDSKPTGGNDNGSASKGGRWQFVLEALDSDSKLEATDFEEDIHPDRLALLAVVRGLEALDHPSQVRLVTTSRYVSRGLRFGLSTWRDKNYEWERFGERIAIRNADMWQRVDQALNFHAVTARLLRPELTTSAGRAQGAYLQNHTHTVADQPAAQGLVTDSVASGLQTAPQINRNSNRKAHQAKDWWELADSWRKWWRGRLQPSPALMGT